MSKEAMLTAFYDLEKTRLRQIEGLIPHFQQLRHNHKDKQGQTLTYYSGMVEGCSIGHLVPAYFYDGFYKFDCLAAGKSGHPCVSQEVVDRDAPQSLHFWYKQMEDKVNFRTTHYTQWDRRPQDPKADPLQYYLDTPTTESVPKASDFADWPLKRDAFLVEYDYVPKKRVMFQPKKTANHEQNIDFYVSPRMFIRYSRVWVTDVMYSDCFEFEAIAIAKEVGGVWNFE